MKYFSEEQIIRIPDLQGSGMKVVDICREQGISEQAFFRYKNRHGGISVSDTKRQRALEDENRQLKQIVADQVLDMHVLQTPPELGR